MIDEAVAKVLADPAAKEDAQNPNCAIVAVIYTNIFAPHGIPSSADMEFGEWCWIVTFRDLIRNDHSRTYQVKRSGEVVLIKETV